MKVAEIAAVLIILALAGGCSDPMSDQGRIVAFGPRSARQRPPGSVPQGPPEAESEAFATGKVRGAFVQTFPIPITSELRESGRNHYETFCGVCHGPAGDGDGIVVQFGFPHPPSYSTPRLRRAPIGYFYDVVTNGAGKMYGYGDRIAPTERWAIVVHIRALQASQGGSNTDPHPKTASPLRGGRNEP